MTDLPSSGWLLLPLGGAAPNPETPSGVKATTATMTMCGRRAAGARARARRSVGRARRGRVARVGLLGPGLGSLARRAILFARY